MSISLSECPEQNVPSMMIMGPVQTLTEPNPAQQRELLGDVLKPHSQVGGVHLLLLMRIGVDIHGLHNKNLTCRAMMRDDPLRLR